MIYTGVTGWKKLKPLLLCNENLMYPPPCKNKRITVLGLT